MLNKSIHINTKAFGKNVAMTPTRNGFGEGIVQAGEDNKDVVVLSADLTESTRCQNFADRFPERFFECGVAEQGMATVAAGLGVSGKIPFIASYATFSPGRNWEQIRTTAAYNDANVKIAGHHAGISVGPDGATHQAIEDIATMRVIPNMKVIVPCDVNEARKATLQAARVWGPVYLRFSREKTAEFTTEQTPFRIGKAEIYFQTRASEVLIIACGPLLHNALQAARELKKEKIPVTVLNSHTIKPLDEKTILSFVKDIGAVVTVEEHNVVGGLGGAVAELLARRLPAPQEFVGIRDMFAESGPPFELWKKYGLDVPDIKEAVGRAMRRK